MKLTDVIGLLNQQDERGHLLHEFNAWITIAHHLATSDGSDDRLRKHFESLPSERLHELAVLIDDSGEMKVFEKIENIRERLYAADSSHDVNTIREISDIKDKSSRAENHYRIIRTSVMAARSAIYILPVFGAYLLGTYYRYNNTLYVESEVFARPQAVYEQVEQGYDITNGYRDEFLKDYSRYYFDRPNHFIDKYWTRDPLESPPITLRITLRNPKQGDPLLVSAVEAIAIFNVTPFPWGELDVTPELSVTADENAIYLEDTGIGPALNVKYTLSTQNLMISEESRKLVYHTNINQSLYHSTDHVLAVGLQNDQTTLDEPVYWARNDASKSVEMVQCNTQENYEVIRSVARLGQLTSIQHGGEGVFELTYESIRGEEKNFKRKIPLPASVVYAARDENLYPYNPCIMSDGMPAGAGMGTGAPAPFSSVDKILASLDSKAPSLKGVDLIKTALEIDLEGIEKTAIVKSIDLPAEILNPAGYLLVDVRITNPATGRLSIAVRVNGNEVRKLDLPILAPPGSNKFDQWNLEHEIAKLRG